MLLRELEFLWKRKQFFFIRTTKSIKNFFILMSFRYQNIN